MNSFADQIAQNAIRNSQARAQEKTKRFSEAIKEDADGGVKDFFTRENTVPTYEDDIDATLTGDPVLEQYHKSDTLVTKQHLHSVKGFKEYYDSVTKTDTTDMEWMPSTSRLWRVPISKRDLQPHEIN